MVKRCVWVGQVCCDVIEGERWRWGGGVYYGALACARLGALVSVWTVTCDGVTLPAGVRWVSLGQVSEVSALTTFENVYDVEGARVQRVRARGPSLVAPCAEVLRREEAQQLEGALCVLAPLLDELEVSSWCELVRGQGASFVALLAQGLCRQVDDGGVVSARARHEWIERLEGVDLVVISQEDIGADEEVLARLVSKVKIVAYTMGADGARLYQGGVFLGRVGVWAVEEVIDPTGAGDVFGAVLASRLAEGQPLWDAARDAAAGASFVVGAAGAAYWEDDAALKRRSQEVARFIEG